MEQESPLDGMTRPQYEKYQDELTRLLSGKPERIVTKTRSDKGKPRRKRRLFRKLRSLLR